MPVRLPQLSPLKTALTYVMTSSPRSGLVALAFAHGFSALADGIYFVALPWLALELTGSTAALGSVLALAALPRTLFMIIGGAWADRFSPKWLLVASSALSAGLVGLLGAAAAGWLGTPAPWMLYAAATALGVVDAIAFPAAGALVPRLVAPEHLHRANALLGVLTQATTFLGPAAAAALLAWQGSGLTLAASGAFSILAVVTLSAVPDVPADDTTEAEPASGSLDALMSGFRFLRTRPVLLAILGLLAGLNLGLVGPIIVGGAALAEGRYGGPEAFGAIVAAWGAGGLIGSIAASLRVPRRPVAGMLATSAGLGLAVAAWGLPMPLVALLALVAGMGLIDGWLEVHSMTWIQQQTPQSMQGRVMGVMMVALVGMEPLSYAMAGALMGLSIAGTFVIGAGITLAATALAAFVIAGTSAAKPLDIPES